MHSLLIHSPIHHVLSSFLGIVQILESQYFVAKGFRVDLIGQLISLTEEDLLAFPDLFLCHFLTLSAQNLHQLVPRNTGSPVASHCPENG
jgi:hypothetical protein